MNYLAHLFFSRPGSASRVGNLLGDFRRGVSVRALPVEVRAGLYNHLCVDAYTDQHPRVLAARRGFSRQRRRFAGIALDVLFDHFLIRHWSGFATTAMDDCIEQMYRDLSHGEGLMPPAMRRRIRLMREQDWLRAYGQLESVEVALDGIARRLRFSNPFAGIMDEIKPRESELEAAFLSFFPDLCRHVESRGIELPASMHACPPVISGHLSGAILAPDWHELH